MKKLFLVVLLLQFTCTGFAQTLSHVALSNGITLTSFSFITDQQAIIRISPDGKMMEWGTELEPGRMGYYQGKLQPYMGRVEYYGQEADEAFRGKVKSIGTCNITYYTSSQPESQKGKVRTIGSVLLDYYMTYDNESFAGKLKSAGNVAITYYASFDNESFKGKLKSVGNTSLTYYSIFDDKFNKGKIKSIGSYNYAWYNNFDRKELQGALKTGNMLQKINGVTYNIWQ
ncbi:hypothetical protein [Ferruginibacter profundus]